VELQLCIALPSRNKSMRLSIGVIIYSPVLPPWYHGGGNCLSSLPSSFAMLTASCHSPESLSTVWILIDAVNTPLTRLEPVVDLSQSTWTCRGRPLKTHALTQSL